MPELTQQDIALLGPAIEKGMLECGIGAVCQEAAKSPALEGHFADRNPVMPEQDVAAATPTLNNEFTPT